MQRPYAHRAVRVTRPRVVAARAAVVDTTARHSIARGVAACHCHTLQRGGVPHDHGVAHHTKHTRRPKRHELRRHGARLRHIVVGQVIHGVYRRTSLTVPHCQRSVAIFIQFGTTNFFKKMQKKIIIMIKKKARQQQKPTCVMSKDVVLLVL